MLVSSVLSVVYSSFVLVIFKKKMSFNKKFIVLIYISCIILSIIFVYKVKCKGNIGSLIT